MNEVELKQMKEEVEKLNQLLEDNETGLMSWWGCLSNRMATISELYYGPATMGKLKK